MQILTLLRERFAAALSEVIDNPQLQSASLERIVPSREPQLADYQANIAMPLAKPLGKPPLEIAKMVVDRLNLDDICESVSIAGAGYINLRLSPTWIAQQLNRAANDHRLGVDRAAEPKTYVVDYSSPNVAKPMHVGHIRSTVIGDAIANTLRFLGHRVVTDNHLGDWGTQFGMIIYGYKHFRDEAAYQCQPVAELSRLYRHVQSIIAYQDAIAAVPKMEANIQQAAQRVELARKKHEETPQDKKAVKEFQTAQNKLKEAEGERASKQELIAQTESSPKLVADARAHADLNSAVLAETAALHRGDKENLKLWHEFLPRCLDEIHAVYDRLGIKFDHEYGESYYHDLLGSVIEELFAKSLAVPSNGAICVFVDGFDSPMIVQKQDGAYLYATTDIATAMFREREFEPDACLYVVDHRQSEHFAKLFAVLEKMGYQHTQFKHISFGTVLGKDGKPFKTRSGSTVGLEPLLDEAVERAWAVACDPNRLQGAGLEMDEAEKRQVAEIVGIGAIKYADLSHNRESNYVFDMDKMVQLEGNTAAYIQYSYARTRSILRKAEAQGWTPEKWQSAPLDLQLPIEAALGLQLIRFEEMLQHSMQDYLPNFITEYLFDTARTFSSFFDQCPVLKAETESMGLSRLKLTHLVGQTLRVGLELLGIRIVERM
ncbi:MAG: arginine--tRNA ligase [Planctomycetota bacterium]|jgi:arginyl-tRNA synthetase